MNEVDPIDIVVLWVDDQDEEWLSKREKYKQFNGTVSNIDCRYRDWGLFKYWFRGIERHIKWFNKIHLVTAGHFPSWLRGNHPKLNLVKHSDFIDIDCLPTFSSRPIELNIHRIEGLANKFIYFNDDMFVLDDLSEDLFFQGGRPTDMGVRSPIPADSYSIVLFNSLRLLFRHYQGIRPDRLKPANWYNPRYGRHFFRNLLLFPWAGLLGFYSSHKPTPYLISDFERVWCLEKKSLNKVCRNKFRNEHDVNHQVFRWARLIENRFVPVAEHRIFNTVSLRDDLGFLEFLKSKKYPVVCLNDNESTNFAKIKEPLLEFFDKVFPEKSSFEI